MRYLSFKTQHNNKSMNKTSNLLRNLVIVLTLICTTYGHLSAQENESKGLNGGTLDSQFNYIIDKSSTYQEYKVIKKTSINKVKNNTLDSIASLKEKIGELETNDEKLKNDINSVKTELQDTEGKLAKAIDERDSFSFLGLLISKGTYNTIVWVLIFVLLLGIFIMFTLYKRSHVTTVKTKEALNEKQEEFDAHRKWALEREQTLARELNKIKQKYKGLE